MKGDLLHDRFTGLARRYPDRTLVPFARRQDNDDVACWDGHDGGGMTVVVIHDFAGTGEARGGFADFNAWLRQAVEDLIELKQDEGPKGMGDSLVSLSRIVSHALRHEPWVYELELDAAGWVSVSELIESIRELSPRWRDLKRDDVVRMVESSAKQRYEIVGSMIRASYGHSLPGRIVRVEAVPPDFLFHGTSPQAWESIATQGLTPMKRQYVHLSADVGTAIEVGRRKSRSPLVLTVHAHEAIRHDVRFWRGNDKVWLTDAVPAEFITTASHVVDAADLG